MTHIDEMFRTQVARDPSRPFIHFAGGTLTYGDVDSLVARVAGALTAAADVRGRFVGLTSPNRPEFVAAYLAILRAGGKVAPLNPRLGPDEVRYMVGDANMPLIVHPPDIETKCGGVAQPMLETGPFRLACTAVPAAMQGSPPRFPVDIADVAVCIYTSGTTGRPKGALLTHAALLHNAAICAHGLRSTISGECLVAVLPLFHAFAASACMLHAMLTGSRLLVVEQFHPQDVLRMMAEHEATVFLGVPAMYGVFAGLDTPLRIPSWRLCISGGAPLPVAIATAFATKFGMAIHEGDGPTECGPATSINPVGGPVKTGTVGVPLRDVEMKIVDDTMRDLPDGTVGEIVVRSPSNFIGYLNQPEETAVTLVDGWVRTGDLGHRDADGYFSIVDRKKDMLIVGGLNVYTREVEDYVQQHPAVADVAVVGEMDGLRGEVPVAYVSLKKGATLDLPTLKAFLRERIAGYKIPRRLHVLEAMPRNATGKILKTVLRKSNH